MAPRHAYKKLPTAPKLRLPAAPKLRLPAAPSAGDAAAAARRALAAAAPANGAAAAQVVFVHGCLYCILSALYCELIKGLGTAPHNALLAQHWTAMVVFCALLCAAIGGYQALDGHMRAKGTSADAEVARLWGSVPGLTPEQRERVAAAGGAASKAASRAGGQARLRAAPAMDRARQRVRTARAGRGRGRNKGAAAPATPEDRAAATIQNGYRRARTRKAIVSLESAAKIAVARARRLAENSERAAAANRLQKLQKKRTANRQRQVAAVPPPASDYDSWVSASRRIMFVLEGESYVALLVPDDDPDDSFPHRIRYTGPPHVAGSHESVLLSLEAMTMTDTYGHEVGFVWSE